MTRAARRLPTLAVAAAALCGAARSHAAPLVLRVGSSGDYPPFSARAADGTATGFDLAVARRLAADLGRPLRLVPFRWPELTTALDRHAFDVAMSGVTVTADRAVHVAFTRPYAVTGAVAVMDANGATRFRALADLDRDTVRLVVNAGGHLEQVARQRFPHARISPVADNRSLPALLRDGAADAAITDALEVAGWPGHHHVLGPFTRDCKAYALPGDAATLGAAINEWLAAREADGWLNGQRRRWLGRATLWTPQHAGFEALTCALTLRLQLMPAVAAAKRRAHLPIEDPAQEARVITAVSRDAAAAGLVSGDVAALFRLQMDLAKAVEQRATQPPQPDTAAPALAELRTAIARVTAEIVRELSRCQPWLTDPAQALDLEKTISAGLVEAGLPEARGATLAAALTRIRRLDRHGATP